MFMACRTMIIAKIYITLYEADIQQQSYSKIINRSNHSIRFWLLKIG